MNWHSSLLATVLLLAFLPTQLSAQATHAMADIKKLAQVSVPTTYKIGKAEQKEPQLTAVAAEKGQNAYLLMILDRADDERTADEFLADLWENWGDAGEVSSKGEIKRGKLVGFDGLYQQGQIVIKNTDLVVNYAILESKEYLYIINGIRLGGLDKKLDAEFFKVMRSFKRLK